MKTLSSNVTEKNFLPRIINSPLEEFVVRPLGGSLYNVLSRYAAANFRLKAELRTLHRFRCFGSMRRRQFATRIRKKILESFTCKAIKRAVVVGDQVLDEGRSTAGENNGSAEQMRLARADSIAQRVWAEVKRY